MSRLTRSKRGQTLSVARRITLTAVFAALAFSAIFLFRFNVGTFLTFDLKDSIITLAGLLLGPATALSVSFLVAMLEFVVDNDTGWYGLIMNFASSATFSVICAVMYRYRKKLSGAILGLILAVLTMVLVMMGLNLLITPIYTGFPRAQVAGMIPTLLLPFNLIKGTVNAALVLILYKPIRRALHAARLLPHAYTTEEEVGKGKRAWVSILVSIVGILVLAGALAAFLWVLHGSIVFW
jgi:riboflavin transporter FmnP